MNSESSRTFFPNLDGLRFFAFFMVFVHHCMNSLGYNSPYRSFDYARANFLKNGDLGVSFFFVLSGFLITWLLMKEKEMKGKINIPHFYTRRLLRIAPLYFLVVALCLWFFPLLNNHLPMNFPIMASVNLLNPLYYLTFTGNFDLLAHGISNYMIAPLWSVSVEQQFYVFCPLLIAVVPPKYRLHSFLFIIAGAVAFRYFYANGKGMIIHYHTLSSMSDLAMGCLAAVLSVNARFIRMLKSIPAYLIVIIYLIGFSLMPLRLYTWKLGVHYVLASSLAPLVFAVFFAFIIMEQNYSHNSFYKISRWKTISSLGKYTYGMYCYHTLSFFSVLFLFQRMGITISGMDGHTYLCVIITSLFVTFLVSTLSYHYFEIWFLKLKKKFG